MNTKIDVAIIGAGPYGLSLAAHLNAAGVEHRVFGTPMEAWRSHMPPGMHLKSTGESSNLFDPHSDFTLEDFSREKGLDYHPSRLPVKLETFIAYGRAFQQRFAPRVEPKQLVALSAADRGYELSFDSGETVTARRVVLAIGVVPFKHTPSSLAHLPAALASHSSDYGPLDRLEGKDVTVLGGGSSALDIAALLTMRGAAVTIVSRSPRVIFYSPPGPDPSLLRRLISPSSGLGGGWPLRICADAPQLIHLLPDRMRHAILTKTLGPAGGYFIRDQVERNATLKLARAIAQAEERGGRVRLTTVGADGARETIESDHIVAATGYRVDLRRLGFLDDSALQKIRTVDHSPTLNANFESSAPGLYFVGLASARSFGPVMRFVVGADRPARRLGRLLPKSLLRRPISISAAIPEN
jgi:cation diffusion facilitator CzcD-associated flavoprotein CzcO